MYRYDMIGISIIIGFVLLYFRFFLKEGVIIFSDVDFPYDAKDYMNQIIGIWNHRFNTTAMLNTPRLLSILPSLIASRIFSYSGQIFLKFFVFQNIYLACFSFYLFVKRLLRVYYNPQFDIFHILIIVLGSLYYGLNPWVMYRIQHVYLLVGYSLFPFVLLQFFKIFDLKFQAVVIEDFDPFHKKIYPQTIKDSILLGLAISISAGAIHYFFYTALLFIGLIMLLLLKYTVKYIGSGFKKLWIIYSGIIKRGMVMVVFIVGFSAFWLFIYFGSILLGTEASQNNINVLDTYTAFSRYSQIHNVFYLISYWWPMVSMDMYDQWFFISGGFILCLSLLGFSMSIRQNHIILFMGSLGLALGALATGVYYKPIAAIFLRFVDLPVIGSLFRDPNKLAGILALCLGISFVFGMNGIVSRLQTIQFNVIAVLIFVAVASACVTQYVYSNHKTYVAYFYAPVKEPLAYSELSEFMKTERKTYAIYLPLSEEMLQQTKIATPTWNATNNKIQKATGDVHIYNSAVDTLFQYEGNDLSIPFYLRYLQWLIDEKRTDLFGDYIELLGSKTLVYHKEYLEQEQRQQENLELLEKDHSLKKIYSNSIFTVFDVTGSDDKRTEPKDATTKDATTKDGSIDGAVTDTKQYIYSTRGLDAISQYQKIPGYDPLVYPIIFAYQDEAGSDILLHNSVSMKTKPELDGIIDAKNYMDLLMSLVSDDDTIYPFDWINEGNPFIKWSKTYTTSTDWSWYLSSQNILNRDFNFDRNGGVAVTFASAMLDVLPYEKKSIVGKKIMDFNQLLEKELFFAADNKELFEVQGNPYNGGNDIQTIHGELAKGDPKEIWQVAKSGLIEARPNTPYAYDLTMSGRFINALHFKVRFFDENMKEVGISYIVSPDEDVNFDTIKFTGEVISPPDTTWMRIDLLTFQKPEVKSYWWIHDFNIYDLSDYVAENKVTGTKSLNEAGAYHLFVRSFLSSHGGSANVTVQQGDADKTSYQIDTVNSLNGFSWIDLGNITLDQGDATFSIENKKGFNGINSIVVIREEALDALKSKLDSIVAQHRFIITGESTLDMTGIDHLQSQRTYPDLSYGQGVSQSIGRLHFSFDCVKKDVYLVDTSVLFPQETGTVQLVLKKRLDDHSYIEVESKIFDHTQQPAMTVDLDIGHYDLEIITDSEARNYSPIEEMHPFDPGEIWIKKLIQDSYSTNCSECEKITSDMMQLDYGEGHLDIYYQPTCSCDWYIDSSNRIDVTEKEEWYIRFRARSEDVTKRHSKVIYVDEHNEPIGYTFISEVEEKDKHLLNDYEQIFEIPEGAVSMYVQFWARGDKEKVGHLYIEDLELYRYKDFITVDHSTVIEEGVAFDTKPDTVLILNKSEGSITYGEAEGILNTFLSPNHFWQTDDRQTMYKLNGVTSGYVIEPSETVNLKIPLYKIYVIGLWITGITGVASIFYFIWKGRRR